MSNTDTLETSLLSPFLDTIAHNFSDKLEV